MKKDINRDVGVLDFDENGYPTLLDKFPSNLNDNSAWYEKIAEKYKIWRGDYLNRISETSNEFFSLYNEISTEFAESDLNKIHPLQDKRNKCMRLKIIETEKKFFTSALNSTAARYEEFIQSLPYVERLAFWVASFFDSTSFDFNISSLTEKMNTNSLKREIFNTEKVAKFGETKIMFNGKEIPVEIVSGFDYDFYGRTYFYLKNQETTENLGHIGFVREWKDKDTDKKWRLNYFSELEAGQPTQLYKEGRSLRFNVEDSLGQDRLTGDRPILRLLTQIAVEVFSCEPEVRLAVDSVHANGYVFAAAGFRTEINDSKDTRILDEIREARNQEEKMLFPPYKDLSSYDVYMYKMDNYKGTKIINKNQNQEIYPAMVDFVMDAEPITWEQQIDNNRFFKIKGTGQYFRNL
ncbi:MAG: hypothetical protein H0T62_07385 [Parachlamydiaceae bacterium]|nr:hypothetical protein [Parachlamydiaceae bacterium]